MSKAEECESTELSKHLAAVLALESTYRQHMDRAQQPPPRPVLAQTPTDLLRHPLCVGAARRVVLDQLGHYYGRQFEDQWDFVRFAEEQELGLDFTNPVQRP
jgi:hypothetical protein